MSKEWAHPVSGRARAVVCGLAAFLISAPVAGGLWSGMAAPARTLEARPGIEFIKAEVLPAGPAAPGGHTEALAALAGLFSPYAPPAPAHLGMVWRKWLTEDAAYIIAPEERREYLSADHAAGREAFIARFWERRGRAAKVEHYRRIEYANARFRASAVPGWRTDRGRLYIVMGPPDEIDVQPERNLEVWRYSSFDATADGLAVTFRPLP